MAFDQLSFSSIAEVKLTYQMIVPEYQRGYSWGESQWNDIWDDAIAIDESPDAQREHFAGSIMISSGTQDENGLLRVDLIDGQQRWTTIALMLKALGDNPFSITYKENEPLQAYFDYYVSGNNYLSSRLAEFRSFYTRNLEEAEKFFTTKAEELDNEKRASLIHAINHRFKIFILTIQPTFDVHVAFETINNRGKPLSSLEKLKNRLIFLASKSNDDIASKKTIATIHSCWKVVYGWLGRGPELLPDDDFLRAHALGWFRHEKRADWLSTQLFNDEFSARSQINTEYIEEYVRSLEQAALWWYRLNDTNALPGPISKGLTALDRTPSATSKPLILWALIRLAKDYPSINVNPANNNEWIPPFINLLAQAERFAILVILANDRQANVGQSDINRSTYALSHPGTSIYQKDEIPPIEAKLAVDFAALHLRNLTFNTDKLSIDESDFETNKGGYFELERVRVVIADRFRKRKGYYNWQLGKILIYLWEEDLRGDRGLPERKSWENIAWDDSVEHIYPQTPDEGGEWAYDISFDGRTTDYMRSSVVNSIGNLLLVSRNRNSSLSNKSFQSNIDKKGKADQYQGASYSEDQVAKICKNWTAIQIAARGIAMWRLAQKRWGVELVSEEQKLTDWLPFLFGEHAKKILEGAATHKKAIKESELKKWVDKFEMRK